MLALDYSRAPTCKTALRLRILYLVLINQREVGGLGASSSRTYTLYQIHACRRPEISPPNIRIYPLTRHFTRVCTVCNVSALQSATPYQACVDEMQAIVDSTRRQRVESRLTNEATTGDDDATANNSAHTSVYEEMLNDCRKKAGEATLDRLRQLCQRKGSAGAAGAGGMEGDLDEGGLGEEETVMVSYHAVLLGRAEGAANIYGG